MSLEIEVVESAKLDAMMKEMAATARKHGAELEAFSYQMDGKRLVSINPDVYDEGTRVSAELMQRLTEVIKDAE